MIRILLSSISIICICLSCAGQMYSVKSKKAIKLYEEGRKKPNTSVNQRTGGPDYSGGLKLLKQAIEKEPDFWEAHLTAAEFCEYTGKKVEAVMHLEEALRIEPNHSPSGSTHYYLALLQFDLANYDGAIQSIDAFVSNPRASKDISNRLLKMKESCVFSIDAVKSPLNFNPINIGPGINTEDPEYFPTITVDGKTILFTRRIEDGRVRGPFKEQEDFYISQLSDKNIWQQAVEMPKNVNTVQNEGAPTIAPDGRSLVFVACSDETGKNYGENREGRGSCDLFYTKKLGSRWTNPVNLPGFVNSFHWESQPSLSADGKTLYFVRGIRGRGTTNDSDIYVARLGDDGIWGKPERLPNTINTPEKEESVLIHPDGKTLYFASKGHIGMGGSDLFVSRMDANGNWGKPENLGYPINTSYDENSLMVSPDGEIAFFASDREGGYGDLDIYYFVMPEHLRPTKTLYFEGTVFDVTTRKPVPGKFQLIDLETGDEVIYSEADKLTGDFMVSLPLNRQYALNVSYPGYTFFSQNFNMINSENQEAIHMDVPLVPIESEQPVLLANVFFDLSQSTLRKESFVELNKLAEFLSENDKINIELGGHTDTRGDADKNQKLSEDRAKSVYNYLISKGIDKNRLTYKGYGESTPVISDEQIAQLASEEEKENAHQTNRRTEYKIIKK